MHGLMRWLLVTLMPLFGPSEHYSIWIKKREGLKKLGWLNFVQMATPTTMKTALKELHTKSPQNLYQALVHSKAK